MAVNNPHSADRSYKLMYKMLGILFHQYLYHNGKNIEFIETEIADTGQRKDIVVKVDDELIQITEFMATALNDKKLHDLFNYHESERSDIKNEGLEVKTGVLSIANPNHGKNTVKIDENVTFHVQPIFTKNKNGRKVLSTIIYKTVIQEELSEKEVIDLLILPDMDIDIPINSLMTMIIRLIGKCNIPSSDLKEIVILCETRVLARFFKEEELKEMTEMLKTETKNPKIASIIEKYRPGFEEIYLDGVYDGISKNSEEIAINLLKDGFDEETTSRNTKLPLSKIKELKRKL